MLYRTCKRMIEKGNIEGLEAKIDVFYARGKLDTEQYNELIQMLAAKQEE